MKRDGRYALEVAATGRTGAEAIVAMAISAFLGADRARIRPDDAQSAVVGFVLSRPATANGQRGRASLVIPPRAVLLGDLNSRATADGLGTVSVDASDELPERALVVRPLQGAQAQATLGPAGWSARGAVGR